MKVKIFYQGDSKECRIRVQTLNEFKGKAEEQLNEQNLTKNETMYESNNSPNFNCTTQIGLPKQKISKWAKYLTNSDDEE